MLQHVKGRAHCSHTWLTSGFQHWHSEFCHQADRGNDSSRCSKPQWNTTTLQPPENLWSMAMQSGKTAFRLQLWFLAPCIGSTQEPCVSGKRTISRHIKSQIPFSCPNRQFQFNLLKNLRFHVGLLKHLGSHNLTVAISIFHLFPPIFSLPPSWGTIEQQNNQLSEGTENSLFR